MPPRTRSQSEFLQKRIASYFTHLILEKFESKKKIGLMLGVSTSRVSQWFSGNRGMMPEIAFLTGERLRINRWRTRGIECGWLLV